MTDLLVLFLICLVGAECWQRRQQSELAERLIKHYCKNTDLQLLSIARQSFGIPLCLSLVTQKANAFVFEYSVDGVGKEEGELYLVGLQQPIFRVDPSNQREPEPVRTGIVINMPTNHETNDTTPVTPEHNNVIPFPQKRQRH